MVTIEPKRIAVQARVMVWRVGAFSHQRVSATADYLWDNRERKPARQCVFQYTVGRGRLLLTEQADDGAWEPGEKALAKRMVSIRSVAQE